MRNEVIFTVNGQELRASADEASLMLAEFLRKRKNLPGTKIVCAEGDCGACTLLKAAPFEAQSRKSPRYLPVNSCIIPVASLDGSRLVTVDGLADQSATSATQNKTETLHPVQTALIKCHGSQCGFCTPGFVMALAGLVEERLAKKETSEPISEREAKNALTANLCRCTGYQPIVNAACSINLKECVSIDQRANTKSQLATLKGVIQKPLFLETSEFQFFAPTKIEDAGRFMKKNSDAQLLSGATDLGVLHNKRKQKFTKLVSLHLIPELYKIQKKGSSRVNVGARVTLSEVREFLKETLIPEFARFLDLFASPQIKNQATLVGNLANASPIGDTSPFLLVAGTVIHTFNGRETGTKRRRKIPIEEFFLGYRKTSLKKGEFITSLEFDIPAKAEYLVLKKVSQRKDLDISTVNAAFRVKPDRTGTRILEARVAFGGVAATPLRIEALEKALEKKSISELNIEDLAEMIHASITPLSDVRSSSAFRRVTAENLLRRFIEQLQAGKAASK